MEQKDLSLFLKPKTLKPEADKGGDITRRFAMNKVGRLLAAALQDRSIRLYDARNCEEIQQMQDEFLCTSLAFSPRGDIVATGGVDRMVKLWDIRTGSKIATLEGHDYPVLTLAFSPEGDKLVSGSGDTTLIIWDIGNQSKLFHLKGHSLYVVACDWSPDGSTIVSGEVDGSIRVWNAETGVLRGELKDHRTAVHALKFTHDGTKLVSGSSDLSIILWERDGELFTKTNVLLAHSAEVRCLAFSTDDRYMASGSSDKMIYVWSMDSLSVEGEGSVQSEVDGIEWFQYEYAFLSADGTGAIILWEVAELETMLAPFTELLAEIEADSEQARQEELTEKYNALLSQYDPETLRDKRLFYAQWQCKKALGLLKGTTRS
ncbi:MAG: WD40 repeat domain-containing protein [Promethearchaeota archaeon]